MNILNYIGKTPLVKLNLWNNEKVADIYVKLECFNPGGSIKTRVAYQMICDAEKNNILQKNDTIIEATGGNTGIGIALISLIKGYKFIAVVPDNYSVERIRLLKIYNANVVLSNSDYGNDSHINLLNDIKYEHKDYHNLNQFRNRASLLAHYEGTATEILNVIRPDAFVSCVGSGGTFNGIGKRFKEFSKSIGLYVAQPTGCDIFTGQSISHKIQGVSLGIIPELMDYSLVDGAISIREEDVKEVLHKLIKSDGLFLGASSGVNILAAYEIARKLGKGKIVCTVAPDSGQYYLQDFYDC